MKDCKHTKTYNTFKDGKMIVHCMYCPKILNLNTKTNEPKAKRIKPSVPVRKSSKTNRRRSKTGTSKRSD